MGAALRPLPRPAAPDRRLLLGDPEQDDPALAAVGGGRLDERPGDRFLVLALGEADDRDVVRGRPALELGGVALTDLAEGGRTRDPVAASDEEAADLADDWSCGT